MKKTSRWKIFEIDRLGGVCRRFIRPRRWSSRFELLERRDVPATGTQAASVFVDPPTSAYLSAQVSLTSSASYPYVGQTITLAATVTPPSGGPTPTGTATFYDGGAVVATAAVVNGVAQTTTVLPTGVQAITAVYSGDANFSSSPSTPLIETVVTDVTTLVHLRPVKQQRSAHKLSIRFSVQNDASFALPAPLVFILENLSPGVSLKNRTGFTSALSAAVEPFAVLESSPLGPGAVATLKLVLVGKHNNFVFTPRIIAGTYAL